METTQINEETPLQNPAVEPAPDSSKKKARKSKTKEPGSEKKTSKSKSKKDSSGEKGSNDSSDQSDEANKGEKENKKPRSKKKEKEEEVSSLNVLQKQFWKDQKLPEYKEELKKLLDEGLTHYEITPLSQEQIDNHLANISDITEEQRKDILLRLLVQVIDSSHDNQVDLAKKCKEHIDKLTDKFADLKETFYMDLICNSANLKSYADIKLNYLTGYNFKKEVYLVWEIKNENLLAEVASIEKVSFVKSQRKWKTKALSALDKLIRNIEKAKDDEGISKVEKCKTAYEETLKSRKDEMPEKKAKPAKRNKSAQKKDTAGSPGDGAEEEALKELKKLKIDSGKNSADKSTIESETKAPTDPEILTPIKEATEADEGKKSKEAAKETKESKESKAKEAKDSKEKKTAEKKVDPNQKSLTSFFVKKDVNKTPVSATKEPKSSGDQLNIEGEKKEKSTFRCLGSSPFLSMWDNIRALAFDSVLHYPNQTSIDFLKQNIQTNKKVIRKCKPKKSYRKIFIHIHDSFRKVKGKFDQYSNKILGRNPIAKDELQIDYDIDSEEEYENQNADNLEDGEEEIEEDSDEEDSEGFVVEDGYLSDSERKLNNDEDEDGKVDNESWKKDSDDLKNRPKLFHFCMVDGYVPEKDPALDEYLNNFKIVNLTEEEFPLFPKKFKQNAITTSGKLKLNPEAVNDDSVLKEIVRAVHGTYNKFEGIEKINAQFPECSKSAIEKKMNEICKKEKLNGESKMRYIVPKEFFTKYSIEPEYELLLKERKEKEDLRQKQEKELKKEKREQEKKLKAAESLNSTQGTVTDPQLQERPSLDIENKESSITITSASNTVKSINFDTKQPGDSKSKKKSTPKKKADLEAGGKKPEKNIKIEKNIFKKKPSDGTPTQQIIKISSTSMLIEEPEKIPPLLQPPILDEKKILNSQDWKRMVNPGSNLEVPNQRPSVPQFVDAPDLLHGERLTFSPRKDINN